MTHSIDATHAKSYFHRLKGLILEKTIKPLYLETRFGIHTFGLLDSIDVIILDTKNTIVRLKSVPKNHVFFWNPTFYRVLELPKNSISEKKIKTGDTIHLKFS